MSDPAKTDPGPGPVDLSNANEESSAFSDTDPGPDSSEATIDDATAIATSEIVERFRAASRERRRGPAAPVQLPFSDGHPFVAYQAAVHRPAPPTATQAAEPAVQIEGPSHADMSPSFDARESDPALPLVAQRDVVTFAVPRRTLGVRVLAVGVGLAFVLLGLALARNDVHSRSVHEEPVMPATAAAAVAPELPAAPVVAEMPAPTMTVAPSAAPPPLRPPRLPLPRRSDEREPRAKPAKSDSEASLKHNVIPEEP